jgi:hypothetical protein
MSKEFESIFSRLREILRKHGGTLSVGKDTPSHYSLEGNVGSATLAAWKGKLKMATLPVAWVRIGKAYVSFHLMGLFGNARLIEAMSKELRARMQGKTCFNFKTYDERLFQELDALTAKAIAAFRKAGFISEIAQINTDLLKPTKTVLPNRRVGPPVHPIDQLPRGITDARAKTNRDE